MTARRVVQEVGHHGARSWRHVSLRFGVALMLLEALHRSLSAFRSMRLPTPLTREWLPTLVRILDATLVGYASFATEGLPDPAEVRRCLMPERAAAGGGADGGGAGADAATAAAAAAEGSTGRRTRRWSRRDRSGSRSSASPMGADGS
jgi:hypothetical protein